MNTQVVNQEARLNPTSLEAEILHEQLALKRLKRLQRLEKRWPLPLKWNWGWLWLAPKALAIVWVALMRRTELKRELAPGQPPEQWHEVERIRQMRALQMM